MRTQILTIGLILLFTATFGQTCINGQELNRNWQFRQTGTEQWFSATVPGCVHTDLMQHGLIPDPYYGLNEKSVQWVDKTDWEYRTFFDVSALGKPFRFYELLFEGLDTYADVYLNDTLILHADNMFRCWKSEITRNLVKGRNELRVCFRSPTNKGLELLKKQGFQLPADNDQSENGGLDSSKVSIFTRKAPYHYGWDWGPRLVTSGIWRPVIITGHEGIRMEDLYISTTQLNHDFAGLKANYTIRSKTETPVQLHLYVDGQLNRSINIRLHPGINEHAIDFTISQPERWWPAGAGKQKRYSVRLECITPAETLAETRNIGLRTLRLVREKDADGTGESFYFEVNGKPVFAKGANVIPGDLFLNRVSPARYRQLLTEAAASHMNMLRVWGGGIYEDRLFYELCDSLGIMVWQDFMFACAMYPGDKPFLKNVTEEARENIIRLRNHPCLALWCGNNEIEVAWAQWEESRGWGWKQRFDASTRDIIWRAYDTLFHHILPSQVAIYHPEAPYWPSSPSGGPGKLEPLDGSSGDAHYWGVWHGMQPIQQYTRKKARFFSEYGFQSYPSLEMLQTIALPEEIYMGSPVMAAHQRATNGDKRLIEYVGNEYGLPEDFSQFVYLAQLMQAAAMDMAIRSHRSAMPYCMGTLYWQLNDCWPVASWAGLDYGLNPKAAHFFIRKAFKPVILNFIENERGFDIVCSSDKPETSQAKLKLTLSDFAGKLIYSETLDCDLPANTAKTIGMTDRTALPSGADTANTFLTAALYNGNHLLDSYTRFFASPRNMKLPEPGLTLKFETENNTTYLRISSDNLCKNLYLQHTNKAVSFGDNFFDILPGQTVSVEIKGGESGANLMEGLRFIHLQEVIK